MPLISGITKDSTGTPCEAIVRAYRCDTGALAGEVVSNATTGAYSITTADTTKHFVVRHVAPVVAGDSMFGNVALLMHFDGNYLNEATGLTATASGSNISIDASAPLYGSGSLSITGDSSYLTSTYPSELPIGTGDYTCEFFANVTSFAPAYQSILNIGSYASGALFRIQSGLLEVYEAGNQRAFAYSFPTGTWKHVAFCRASGTLRAFVDGIQVGSDVSTSVSIPALDMTIGMSQHSSGEYLNGRLEDLRLTKGARYTANFTAPSSALLGRFTLGTPTENAQIFDYVTPA